MNVAFLLYLLLRFVNPVPVVEMPLPEPEIILESPAYIHLETGATIYMGEGQDGTEVNLADLF